MSYNIQSLSSQHESSLLVFWSSGLLLDLQTDKKLESQDER